MKLQAIPTRDAAFMFEALQAAMGTFLTEYTKKKGTEEISDVELQAAGRGFKHMVDEVIRENNERLENGNVQDLRPVTDKKIILHPTPRRVTLTAVEGRR